MTRLVVVVVSLFAVLSGCRVCTAIGCVNSVTFQLGAAAQHFRVDEPVEVSACVGTQCVTETVTVVSAGGSQTSTGGAVFFGTDGSLEVRFNTSVTGAQTVTLKLTKMGTVVLDQSRGGVTFSTFEPNGAGCQPICQTATVAL